MKGGTHLYIAQMDKTGAFKVGRSKDPRARLKQLQTGCPHTIRLVLTAKNQGHLEKQVHQQMQQYRTRMYTGEWFHESGWGDLPDWLYEQIPEHVLEWVNTDWWRDEHPTDFP